MPYRISPNTSHIPRLFIDIPLAQGSGTVLDKGKSHYLQHVMRLQKGDSIRLFNGRDGEWRAALIDTSKHGAEIVVQEQLRPPSPEPDLWLCCAPIKKAHFEYMIEKATELGVSAIQPMLTHRTQIREVNEYRCRTVAIEAAEQSERLGVPEIRPAMALNALAPAWPKDRTPLVCAEWGEARPIAQALSALPHHTAMHAPAQPKAAIFTGPEGGFAAEELERLRCLPGAFSVRLGPRILRADTAAIAALSCWQAMRGDWGCEP